MYQHYSPSGLYCATMVTVCPAFFRAAAACSCVALDKSTPFTYKHNELEHMIWININKAVHHGVSITHGDHSGQYVCLCCTCVISCATVLIVCIFISSQSKLSDVTATMSTEKLQIIIGVMVTVCLCLSAYRQDAISLAQLPTEISWTSSKNKGDEDSLSILSSNYVETETRGPPLEHHPPGFPGRNVIVRKHTYIQASGKRWCCFTD